MAIMTGDGFAHCHLDVGGRSAGRRHGALALGLEAGWFSQ
jgi:hypothetical protein